jgi:hypothetical protein
MTDGATFFQLIWLHLAICGLLKKYPTKFVSFEQESAWCRECDLGLLSMCMNYCFPLGLLVAGNRTKPVVMRVVPVALTTEKV